MSAEWKECTIGEVCCSVSNTYLGHDKKVVLINTSDVFDGDILCHECVPNNNLRGQFKKTFIKNDILYSEIRPANKRYAYVDFENTGNYIASTKLMVIRAKKEKIKPRFLYFLLKSKDIIHQLQIRAETRSGTFPQITFGAELATIKIKLPLIDIQDKIVSILLLLDNKIESNKRANNILQQQAQALFKAWFVDYIPFGGVLPDGWINTELGKIIDITSGKRPTERSIEKTQEFSIPLVGATSVMGFTNAVLYNEKILVTGRVGTHGVIQRFSKSCWASDNTFVIKSKYYEFVCQILHAIDFQSMNRGSTQPLITQSDLKKIPLILPTADILGKFESIVGVLMAQYEQNISENDKLATLRDTLLPKLMSGEIDVSNVKI
jgi:type I restriction enzyme S subunit